MTISLLPTGLRLWFNHSSVQNSLLFLLEKTLDWIKNSNLMTFHSAIHLFFSLKLVIKSNTCLRAFILLLFDSLHQCKNGLYDLLSTDNNNLSSKSEFHYITPLVAVLSSLKLRSVTAIRAKDYHTCLIVFTLPLHVPDAILQVLTRDWNALAGNECVLFQSYL